MHGVLIYVLYQGGQSDKYSTLLVLNEQIISYAEKTFMTFDENIK